MKSTDAANFMPSEPSSPITEDQVVAFLQAKADGLSARCGNICASVEVACTRYSVGTANVAWKAYVAGTDYKNGTTMDDVISRALVAMEPTARAEAMRRQAAELLAQAEKLST